MALERFQQGMNAYLNGVEKAKRRQATVRLTEAATRLSEGEDVEQTSHLAAEINRRLGGEVILIKSLHATVAELIGVLGDGLKKVGAGLPPLEVLKEAPYDIVLTSAEDEDRRYQAKQQIRAALGFRAFHIPDDPDDSEKEIPLAKLGLLRNTQRVLDRQGIDSVGNLVAILDKNLLELRGFRELELEDVLDAMFRVGVMPISDDEVPAVFSQPE